MTETADTDTTECEGCGRETTLATTTDNQGTDQDLCIVCSDGLAERETHE